MSAWALWMVVAAAVVLGSFGPTAESFALPNAIAIRSARRESCGLPALLRLMMITSQGDADSNTFLNMDKVLQTVGYSKARKRTREISDELVSLLQREEGKRNRPETTKTIRALVQQLVDARVTFDPRVCLNDAILYKSYVVDGPSKPLWEQLGGLFSPRGVGNLQGQQYNFEDKSVINYAEIFGHSLHLRAYGTFERDKDRNGSTDGVLAREIFPFSRMSQTATSCPVDYTVMVNRASIVALDRRLEIPIAGTGYLRVLYADSRLRIFVSPKSTTDSRWEKAGLMVVQVRADIFNLKVERLD